MPINSGLLDRPPRRNDLQIAGGDVSRDHAEIEREEGGTVLRDRGSRFGTHVNGEPVTECPLKHGDLVRLGKGSGVELLFLLETRLR